MKTVLLLSSGLDSAANLVLSDFEIGLCLSIDYGQLGAKKEAAHAKALAKHFKIPFLKLDFQAFSSLVQNQSALLSSSGEIPKLENLDNLSEAKRTAKAVWVPNRNGVLLSLAAAVAEARGMNQIAVGFNAEEATTFPDNTTDYMVAMSRSLEYSTANHVKVVSATAQMTKVEIVKALFEKNFPFELLWSCYRAESKHCGVCESCQRLNRALDQGLPEDVKVQVIKELFEDESSI